MCWGGRWHWLSYGKLSGTRLKSLSRRFTTCINIPSSLHTWGKAWTPTRLLQCKKKKEPSSTSWVSVPRHKGDVQHNWHCDQVLKVNAESVRAWTEPLKQAIIFLRVGAVRTQDPQLGQLLVDLLKQLRFPHPVLIQSCLGLDHVFTQSWSCVPPPVMVMTTTLPSSQHSQHLETRYRSCVCITWKLTKRKGRVGGLRARWRGFTSPQVGLERALWS